MNTCKQCGKPIHDTAKYCSNTCQQAYQRKQFISGWLSGEIDGGGRGGGYSRYIKNYLLNEYLDSCQLCGWGELNKHIGKSPLEVHHIDGNSSNNSRDNLQLLCPNCHSLTANHKGSNRNKSSRVN